MSEDCRNDCMDPFQFPAPIENRAGLDHIRYRIGSFSEFRRAMLSALDKDAVMRAWTHRASDDPGIALLEGAAVLGDILTFYQEVYANEAYLRTAQWRESVGDLVRLLGYRLAPGVGGRATFAFEVKGDAPVVIPANFPVKAQVEGLELQAEFETAKEAMAYPALSKFNLYRPYLLPNIDTGTSVFSIDTAVLEESGLMLEEKDRLLLVVDPSDPFSERQVVVVKEVEQRFERTEIEIEGSWQRGYVGSDISVYKLGRSFRHFGHNAPPEVVNVEGEVVTSEPVEFRRMTHQIAVGPWPYGTSQYDYLPVPSIKSMPLDQEVDDLSAGATMLIVLDLFDLSDADWNEHFFERKIIKTANASLTFGSMSGGSTVVELDDFLSYDDKVWTDIRSVEFLEVIGDGFTLNGACAEDTDADLSELLHYGLGEDYRHLDDRQLLLVRDDGIYEQLSVTIDDTLISDDPIPRLRSVYFPEFEEDFGIEDFPFFDEPIVTVFGNLAEARQGKTEKEAVLGNGDSRQTFQTFKLPKAPLTYHKTLGETPPEVPELQIYVNDQLWTRVPTFFNRGASEEIYIVRDDINGDSWVQFGDGKTGKKLPSGVKNVVARYRSGIGAYGALNEETKAQPGAKLTNLIKIQMPGVASGGDQPESGENAKQAAPGKVQSLGRMVSLRDFECEALTISGVTKARAAWRLLNGIPTLVLTVLMETGRNDEIEEVRGIVNQDNRCRGPDRFPIDTEHGKRYFVYLSLDVVYDSTYRRELVEHDVREALGLTGEEGDGVDGSDGLFALGKRSFGEPEYAGRIEGIVQNVAGVVWTKVVGFAAEGESDEPDELTIPDMIACHSVIAPLEGHHILALHKGCLKLNPISEEPSEEC